MCGFRRFASQHRCLVAIEGTALRVNNVELGKPGRWRPHVWTYPGASSLGFDVRRGLKDHPTDKPTAMLDDALLAATLSLTHSSAQARLSSSSCICSTSR